MPVYTFELLDGSSPLCDETGVNLPDREHALAYGKEIARELMQGREAQTRFWRLRIHENHPADSFDISFVAVDPTLDHLVPELRRMVERLCENYRSSKEAIHAARITVQESRALVARSRGQPYLAATSGRRTIR
jgi:hypothetical protein